ncbi:MAG: hypothetical protein RIT27_1300 [Pseudomonadota bacterium]|jgi:1-deoxy-D-xylulose-5-phosphate reductoisomerase
MQTLTILGATGSIGLSTLDVVRQHSDQFQVVALTANQNVEQLAKLCEEFQPQFAVMVNENAAEQLAQKISSNITVLSGKEHLSTVASLPNVTTVMAAIVGAAGLLPTLAAAKKGKTVLLANKESLVMSGQLFINTIKENNATLLPIDSEHNAIFQCLYGQDRKGLERILLTASGGPFRTLNYQDLQKITPSQACAHPNWKMGRKISVDSATLMNKGLEVIEACWLFDLPPNKVEVIIHPQSIIHSLVEYSDGSMLAQLGNPDMRTPIAYSLAFPQRITSGVKSLNLFDIARLDFEKPDLQRFPCLRLAFEAMQMGGTATAILNAANEIAVEAFLSEKLAFVDIPIIIEETLSRCTIQPAEQLEIILNADQQARIIAKELLQQRGTLQ